MSENRDQKIRAEILLQLCGVKTLMRSAEQIERDARRNGDNFTRHEIEAQLQFLADDGLVVEVPAAGTGTTSKLYRIHANGVRHYEQHYAP